jgi:thymidine kinase
MNKIHYLYSTMNAGKTTLLLQKVFKYKKKYISTLILIPKIIKKNKFIKSRIGIKKKAITIIDINIFLNIKKYKYIIKIIFIDEVQFLEKKNIFELSIITDKLKKIIYLYGLKTDFRLNFFEGSYNLLKLSDICHEIKTECDKCKNNANSNIKINKYGKKDIFGDQINANKNIYIPVCRNHYYNLK